MILIYLEFGKYTINKNIKKNKNIQM